MRKLSKIKWVRILILVLGIPALIILGLGIYGYLKYARPIMAGNTETLIQLFEGFEHHFESQDISHYDIDIQINPQMRTLEAKTFLTVKRVDNSKDKLYFLLNQGLKVASVSVGERSLPFRRFWMVLRISLPEEMREQEEVHLSINYRGAIKKFAGWYSGEINEKEVVLMPYISMCFPSEPMFYGDRFTARVRAALPKAFKSIIPGTLVHHEIRGDQQIIEWDMRPPDLGFPILAGEWDSWEEQIDGKLIGIYAPKELQVDGQNLLRLAKFGLTCYSKWFGDTGRNRYSFFILAHNRALNLASMYGGGGTVILVGQFRQVDSRYFLRINHELAHSWIPGMFDPVGLFKHDWIAEGFPEYAALQAAQLYFAQRVYLDMKWAYAMFDPNLPKPVSQTAGWLGGPIDRQLAYQKGAFIYIMLEQIMGKQRFHEVLKTCFHQFRGQKITPDQYLEAVEKLSGVKLDSFYDAWIYGTGWLDFSIEQVEVEQKGNLNRIQVTVLNRGDITFPYETELVCITKTGSQTKKLRIGQRPIKVSFKTSEEVQKIIIDPEFHWADMNRSNNIYPLSTEITCAIPSSTGQKIAVVRKDYKKYVSTYRHHQFSQLFGYSILEIYDNQGRRLQHKEMPGSIMVRSYGAPAWNREENKLLLRYWDNKANTSKIVLYDASSNEYQNLGKGFTPRWLAGEREILFGGADGTLKKINLFNRKKEEIAKGLGQYVHPNLSPLKEKVLVVSQNKLFLVSLLTNISKILLESEGLKPFSSWSPDGESIYFVVEEGKKDNLYRMNIASGEKTKIISSEIPVEYACPSPTSDYFLYITRSEDSEIKTIHLFNLLTQKEKILYQEHGDAGQFPFWSEDGQSIYYIDKEECQAFPSTFYSRYAVVIYYLKNGERRSMISQ